MGKRKRHIEVNAKGGGPNPVEDKRRTRNKKELTASPANKEKFVNVELKTAYSSQKQSPGMVITADKGRKGVNDSTGKAAARQSKVINFQGGESGAKKVFSWSPAQETIALSELVKLTNADGGQSLDKSSIDWEQLATTVGERLDCNLTRTQIYEKARRLKERYTRTHDQVSRGKLNSFKNEDDEKMYDLSRQIWGTLGAIRLQLEKESDLQSGNLEKKFTDADNIHKDDSLPDDETPGLTMEKETAPKKYRKDLVTPSEPKQGTPGAVRLQPEEERDLLSGNLEKKFSHVDNTLKDDSLPDGAEVETPGVTMEKETAPKKHRKDLVSPSEPKQGTTAAHDQANPDLDKASQSKIDAIEGDTQKTLEVFRAEHQALLKELEQSCVTVLQDMQVKFLSMMNNTVRGSQFPCMRGGVHVPSFEFITQAPPSWDKLVDNCLSTSTNKPAAFENLYEQWQQQRLQELKLTSMKLHLMLEDCQMEQEKLEKQVLKSK